jgi:hypothetical protein
MRALAAPGLKQPSHLKVSSHRVLHTRVWVVPYASYLRGGFGELIATRFIG